jgi:aminopeptidase YwaD
MKPLFDGDNAFKHIEKLASEIGARPGGSPEDKRAAGYIKSYFEELGLDVSTQEFEIETGYTTNQSLEITAPYEDKIPCAGLSMIGKTGPEGVEGALVYIETTDEEYLTPEITGKIVVTNGLKRKNLDIVKKLKPLGFIFVETYPGVLPKHFWGNYPENKNYGNYPSVRISFEEGLKLMKKGVKKARIVVEAERGKKKTQNIIAELKGTTNPDEIVFVGGHYDTVPDVRGASDNAGGTSIVMELARVFKDKGSKRTIRFVAWGSEEMGLDGSNLYAKKLKADDKKTKEVDKDAVTELDKVKLSINLDVHGALIGTNVASVLGPSMLTHSIKLLSKEKGTVFDVKETVYSSDGTPFSAIGVPSLSFSRKSGIDIMMHSTEDIIEYLSPDALVLHGVFVETWMTRYITGAAAYPFEKEVPEKLMKEILDYYDAWKSPLP